MDLSIVYACRLKSHMNLVAAYCQGFTRSFREYFIGWVRGVSDLRCVGRNSVMKHGLNRTTQLSWCFAMNLD